jgi:Ca-activated chloride channel family protein
MMLKLVLGLVACLCITAPYRAQERFESGVSLVHLDAEVLDVNHRVVTGLRKDDFAIYDNDHPQAIAAFAAEEQPLDLMLLFDTSLSMRGVVDRIAKSAEVAFKQLRPGDRVGAMVFNSRTTLVLPWTTDFAAAQHVIEQAIVKERFGSSTKIQDAVADAGAQLQRGADTQRRRAILIVTDDVGVRTRREDPVVRGLWQADASLNGIIVRDEKFAARMRVAHVLSPGTLLIQAGMRGIADKTGGDVIQSLQPAAAFEEMIRRIRSRYSLYYRMPEARHGEIRRVRVETRSGANVRVRRGYIVP